MIRNFKTINIHDRCEVSQMAFLKQNKTIIASIGLNCLLVLTDLHSFAPISNKNLDKCYLTSLYSNYSTLYVGEDTGKLILVDPRSMNIEHSIQIHSDCITYILQDNNNLVTIGNDGLLNVSDKRNLATLQSLKFDSPLDQIIKFNNTFYVAGIKSYKISQTLQFQPLCRYSSFLQAHGKLYGTNDENGFTCITQKQKRYVPCQKMIAYMEGVLGTSWSTVSYFGTNKETSISCKSTKVQQFLHGDTIKSLLVSDKMVYGGAESGNLYAFQYDINYSCLDQ